MVHTTSRRQARSHLTQSDWPLTPAAVAKEDRICIPTTAWFEVGVRAPCWMERWRSRKRRDPGIALSCIVDCDVTLRRERAAVEDAQLRGHPHDESAKVASTQLGIRLGTLGWTLSAAGDSRDRGHRGEFVLAEVTGIRFHRSVHRNQCVLSSRHRRSQRGASTLFAADGAVFDSTHGSNDRALSEPKPSHSHRKSGESSWASGAAGPASASSSCTTWSCVTSQGPLTCRRNWQPTLCSPSTSARRGSERSLCT